mmetsp:Transcript_2881/g.8670  ORF Transcript_2881/g.8670 Transcript_2881/m.8670 type:complete len:209 (-) Transcript_2881:119-745(-)
MDLAPDLQDGVLARVVVHLHARARAPLAVHRRAGPTVLGLGGGRLDHVLDVIPDAQGATGEKGGPLPRAFLPTADPHAQEAEALRLQLLRPPRLVSEMRVPRVHDDIIRLEDPAKLLDGRVRRTAGLHEDECAAGLLERVLEVVHGLAAVEISLVLVRVDELLHGLRRPVEHRDLEAPVRNVQREVAPHYGEADDADITRHGGEEGPA